MRYTNKKILKITFPVLVCLLMEQLIGLTDTAYLGRVGEAELGASALAGIFYLMIFMLGFGFSIGAQILIARRNGAKEYSQIGPLFMQSTAFLLLMALVLFILSKVFAARIMGALIEAPDVREAAVRYLDYRVYGFFFAYVGSMFRAFYVGTTRTRILTINSIVMVLTNVVLNYLLIFGKIRIPPKWASPALRSPLLFRKAYPPSSTYSTPAIGPTGAAINSDSQDSTFPC